MPPRNCLPSDEECKRLAMARRKPIAVQSAVPAVTASHDDDEGMTREQSSVVHHHALRDNPSIPSRVFPQQSRIQDDADNHNDDDEEEECGFVEIVCPCCRAHIPVGVYPIPLVSDE